MRYNKPTLVFMAMLVLLALPDWACGQRGDNDGGGRGGGSDAPDEDRALADLQCGKMGARCSLRRKCCDGMECVNRVCFDPNKAYCPKPVDIPLGGGRAVRGLAVSSCDSRDDCCKSEQFELACVNAQCVPCKGSGQGCSKSSQCCSGRSCTNKLCRKK
jgi:hypothetical protein